ncbi:MAG: hypothetical protein JWO43_124 [Candidatus Adlerbacteria bacterium]|nr:hypothetical protein [Candidatus Adlerbacteria bacterium]
MSALSTKEARFGLAQLLSQPEGFSKSYWEHRGKHFISLDAHPFELEHVLKKGRRESEIYLVYCPGVTDGSVKGMLLALHEVVQLAQQDESDQPFRLRIIRAQKCADWNNPDKFVHTIFFEVVSPLGTYIAGGCTDCSGGGGWGRHQLESTFNVVAAVCGIPVEEVIISQNRSEGFIDALNDVYNAHTEAKRMADA